MEQEQAILKEKSTSKIGLSRCFASKRELFQGIKRELKQAKSLFFGVKKGIF